MTFCGVHVMMQQLGNYAKHPPTQNIFIYKHVFALLKISPVNVCHERKPCLQSYLRKRHLHNIVINLSNLKPQNIVGGNTITNIWFKGQAGPEGNIICKIMTWIELNGTFLGSLIRNLYSGFWEQKFKTRHDRSEVMCIVLIYISYI